MTCKWQVEIDDYATKVLERHWPNVRRWRDIGDFIADAAGTGPLQRVDLICGGFPCQPVSVAGARRGASDERWLWNEFREVIRILRPRYVLAENVPGLFSAKDAAGRRGGLFGGVVRDMAALGYDAEWGVLPAASFGAPHLRKRVFIIAHSTSFGSNSRRPECQGQQRDVASISGSKFTADADAPGLQKRQGEDSGGAWKNSGSIIVGDEWRSVKPTVCRGDNGVSGRLHRVDRLRCLGNAVVPQVAQWLGERISEFDAGSSRNITTTGKQYEDQQRTNAGIAPPDPGNGAGE